MSNGRMGIHFQRVQLGGLNDRSQSRSQTGPVRVQAQGGWMLSATLFLRESVMCNQVMEPELGVSEVL